MLRPVTGSNKALIAAVVLAICGAAAYWTYAAHEKREQRQALAALVGDTTAQLRKALAAPPAPDLLAKVEGNLQAARAPRDPALAAAAGNYIHSAREIVRRRGDAERFGREAALSRRALAMHIGAASGRDAYWIRIASDLKKRVERDHFELDLSLRALADVLGMLPDAQKRLEPHVDAALLLAGAERQGARERAEQAAKRAAEELEKTRRLVVR